MSSTTTAARARTASTPAGRLRSLARAELTLLMRNRTTLFMALAMPPFMVAAIWSSMDRVNLADTGLTAGGMVMTGGIGMVLLLVVYANLVAAFVARREERVLKRLRTGEVPDREILAGTALPSVALALTQCVLLVLAGAVLLDLTAPQRPGLLLAGVVLGVVMMVLLAVATTAFTRTVEAAQITALPLLMVSAVGSGLFVPFELLPDQTAAVLRLLPLSPVMELVRYGWLGGLDGTETLRALGLAVAWTALAVFAVRRWFRWEPRQ
ncbi:ABC transporter permease [Streptomyces sp. ACA25]|uniref:ABC transporter permease n=1 Tax=Streptomyces sp. ACA25 TaxID=3022596 RepID=UPI002307F24B|nr:ABC transporter permease [Streptomyces sp. ACA25]MDB1086009.1 ABC transporter permease [Streptomyces sp. ACA25]